MRQDLKAGAAALLAGLLAGSLPAYADFWSDAGAKFKGVTLHGVTESTPPSNYIKDVLAPEFEAKTGIKVEIETTSWDQMYDKAIKDMEAQTGIYDMVYIEQDIIYAYLARNFLVDITKTLKDDPSLKAPDFDETHFTTFANYFKNADGDLFGVPMEAFIKIYLYRTDLFNDPEIQAAFKEKTGNDLMPAKTHAEYTEIAEFFTEWGKDKGIDLWGTTAQAHHRPPGVLVRVLRVDRADLRRLQLGHRRLEELRSLRGERRHDEQRQGQGRAEVLAAPARHRAAGIGIESPGPKSPRPSPPAASPRAWSMARTRPGSRPTRSSPRSSDKVGVALPPVEPGVMEAAEAGTGYIGYYDGGAFGIPVTSKNQEASLLFLQYIGQD